MNPIFAYCSLLDRLCFAVEHKAWRPSWNGDENARRFWTALYDACTALWWPVWWLADHRLIIGKEGDYYKYFRFRLFWGIRRG